MTARILAALLPLALLACADGTTTDDTDTDTDGGASASALAGIYKTTYQADSQDCGDLEELDLPIPYFQLLASEGADTLELRICRSATDCDDFTEDQYFFSVDGDEWIGGYEFAFWNEGDQDGAICSLNAVRITLKTTAAGVRINSKQAQEGLQSPDFADQADCDEELEDYAPLFNSNPTNCERWDGERVE